MPVEHRFHHLNSGDEKSVQRLFRRLKGAARKLEELEERLEDAAEVYLDQVEKAVEAGRRQLTREIAGAVTEAVDEGAADEEAAGDVPDAEVVEEAQAHTMLGMLARMMAAAAAKRLTLDLLKPAQVGQLEVGLQRAELALCRLFVVTNVSSNTVPCTFGYQMPHAVARLVACLNGLDLIRHELGVAIGSGLHRGGMGARLQQLHASVLSGHVLPEVNTIQVEVMGKVADDIETSVRELEGAVADIGAALKPRS